MRLSMLILLAAATGCGSSMRVVLGETADPTFESGAPFVVRAGGEEILCLARGQILSLDRSEDKVTPLLDEPDSTVVDLALDSEGEIRVLRADGLSTVVGGRLETHLHRKADPGARIVTAEGWIWFSVQDEKARIYRVKPGSWTQIQRITESDKPITALAPGLHGCYFATDSKVYRAVVSESSPDIGYVFLMAIEGEEIRSITADREHEILYVATPSATYFYREGKVRPFHMVGGRIQCEGGSLFVSSQEDRSLVEITRAHLQVEEIESR